MNNLRKLPFCFKASCLDVYYDPETGIPVSAWVGNQEHTDMIWKIMSGSQFEIDLLREIKEACEYEKKMKAERRKKERLT